MAADDLAAYGSSLPDAILRRLQLLEVYHDMGNVVIVLQRDAHEEQGYYIRPLVSSTGVSVGSFGEWTLRSLKGPGPDGIYSDTFYSSRIYAYSRKR